MKRRKMRQITLALFSWMLFAYYWWLVSRRQLNPETLTALSILIVIIGLVWFCTLLWIRHNKALARRAGNRRKIRRSGPPNSGTDSLGRIIEVSGELALPDASYVEVDIDVELGLKRYHAPAVTPLEVER